MRDGKGSLDLSNRGWCKAPKRKRSPGHARSASESRYFGRKKQARPKLNYQKSNSVFFVLHSSFRILHSSFCILPSKFQILKTSPLEIPFHYISPHAVIATSSYPIHLHIQLNSHRIQSLDDREPRSK